MKFLMIYSKHIQIFLLAGSIFFSGLSFAFGEDAPDWVNYEQKCSEGITIYCLTLGMSRQKSGELEDALKFFELACTNHHSHGHLRACTPLLALALQLGRLKEKATSLEKRCSDGNDVTCFYLGTEYLKVTAYQQGEVHLSRLCSENFLPPDPENYGPCYHLANSYRRLKQFDKAVELFQFDCRRKSNWSQKSCQWANRLTQKMNNGKNSLASFKKLKPVEMCLVLLVILPLMGWWFLEKGKPWNLQFLKIHMPFITLICWGVWEFQPESPPGPRMDLIFILPSVLLVFLFSWLASSRLQE